MWGAGCKVLQMFYVVPFSPPDAESVRRGHHGNHHLGEMVEHFLKLPGLVKLTNTEPFAAWFVVNGDEIICFDLLDLYWRSPESSGLYLSNPAQLRQARPDSGLGLQAKVLGTFYGVPFSPTDPEGGDARVWRGARGDTFSVL